MTSPALLRATRYLSQAQAEVRRLIDLRRAHYAAGRFDEGAAVTYVELPGARANVVARRHEVERLEAEAGGAR